MGSTRRPAARVGAVGLRPSYPTPTERARAIVYGVTAGERLGRNVSSRGACGSMPTHTCQPRTASRDRRGPWKPTSPVRRAPPSDPPKAPVRRGLRLGGFRGRGSGHLGGPLLGEVDGSCRSPSRPVRSAVATSAESPTSIAFDGTKFPNLGYGSFVPSSSHVTEWARSCSGLRSHGAFPIGSTSIGPGRAMVVRSSEDFALRPNP